MHCLGEGGREDGLTSPPTPLLLPALFPPDQFGRSTGWQRRKGGSDDSEKEGWQNVGAISDTGQLQPGLPTMFGGGFHGLQRLCLAPAIIFYQKTRHWTGPQGSAMDPLVALCPQSVPYLADL